MLMCASIWHKEQELRGYVERASIGCTGEETQRSSAFKLLLETDGKDLTEN